MSIRVVSFIVFILVFSLIGTGFYIYLVKRYIEQFSKHWLKLFLKIMLIFSLTSPMLTLLFRFSEHKIFYLLSLLGYIGFGFIAYMMVVSFIRDASVFIQNRIVNKLSDAQTSRKVWLKSMFNKTTFALAATSTAYGIYEARKLANVENVKVKIANLPKDFLNFKIVLISDVHIGPTIKYDYLYAIVERINQLKPDMVAITGDLVDGPVSMLKKHVAALTHLKSRFGTFFVTGNHEYYSGAIEWIAALRDMQIKVLMNESQKIKLGKSHINILGVNDYGAHRYIQEHETSVSKAVEGIANEEIKILLAHQPRSIFEAGKHGVDLQLSGHTHGGQFFPFNLVVQFAHPYIKGLNQHDERSQIYVSKGTGYWGPPLRTGVPSEITEIILNS